MTEWTGIHTCQTGRATGCNWFTQGHAWNCPFCGDHGPHHTGPIEAWPPTDPMTILNTLRPQDTP